VSTCNKKSNKYLNISITLSKEGAKVTTINQDIPTRQRESWVFPAGTAAKEIWIKPGDRVRPQGKPNKGPIGKPFKVLH